MNGDLDRTIHDIIPPRYRRVVHPVTGRFLFEFDTIHLRVIVVDRGHQATIDLTQYIDQPIAKPEQ